MADRGRAAGMPYALRGLGSLPDERDRSDL
jgi:hypothetical protein